MTFSPKYQSDSAARPAGQAVAWLRSGAASFEPLLASHEVCAYRMSPDGALLAASPALARLLGYAGPAELCARRPEAGEYDAAYAEALFARHGGLIDAAESEWRRSDGTPLRVYESARASYGPAARPEFYDGVITPIDAPEIMSFEAEPASVKLALATKTADAYAKPRASSLALTAQHRATANISTGQRAMLAGATSITSAPGVASGGSMDFLAYWKIFRKRLWLIVLLMLVGALASGYYVAQRPLRYSSTTTLFLNPAAAYTVVSYQSDGLKALAATYSEFLKTRSFASDVAHELGDQLDEKAILESLSTAYVEETQFFRITATYGEPQMTQRLASAAAKVLIAKNIARQQEQQEQIRLQSQPNPDRERLASLRTTLQSQLDLYDGQIATLQSQLDRAKAQPASDVVEKQILDIQQQLLNSQSLRQSALTGLADAQAALANNADSAAPNLDTAVVVDAAPLPTAPLPSLLLQSVLIALLSAAIVGAGIAFLLEYLDYTVKTPEELDTVYGLPTQGVIGLLGGKRGKRETEYQLVTLNDSLSPIAEAFRALRTNLQFAAMDAPIRSLLITSAGPGEGKTFVAANLAVSIAQNGSRVILVDADLRRPRVHQVFELSRETGLTNLILSQSADHGLAADLDASTLYLQKTQINNLWVLACGPIPPNPAELLGSERSVQIMDLLSQYADVVIYDTPPAATVTDAAIIAGRVDAVLQVVRAGATRIDLLRKCKATLAHGGARILGPVLNQVRQTDMGSYANYYTYSYYGEAGTTGKKLRRKRKQHHSIPSQPQAQEPEPVRSSETPIPSLSGVLAAEPNVKTSAKKRKSLNGKLPVDEQKSTV